MKTTRPFALAQLPVTTLQTLRMPSPILPSSRPSGAAALPAFAHHAAVVFYDMTKEVSMSGTVTEFRMGNPHARICFTVALESHP